jgi:hypothetical protein
LHLFRLIAALLVLVPAGLGGQTPPEREPPASAGTAAFPSALRGQVLLEGTPVTGAPVTLHRVTQGAAGALDSVRTDAAGTFSFRLPAADTAGFTVFFTAVTFRGIRYFGRPLHPGDTGTDYNLEVFDTIGAGVAGAPPVLLSRRNVLMLPRPDGGWEVDELLRIENAGSLTVVSAYGAPTWQHPLPPGATDFEIGDSDVAAEDIQRVGDRVLVTSAVPPGARDLLLRYRLRDGVAALPVGEATEIMNLLLRDPAGDVAVSGLAPGGAVAAEGETLRRFTGAKLSAGHRIIVNQASAAGAPLDPRWTAVAVLLLLLTGGAAAAARRPKAMPDAAAG